MTLVPMWHCLVLALARLLVVAISSVTLLGQEGAATELLPERLHEVVGAGRWLHEGGGLGRNAASANAPLLQRPELAWRQPLPGSLIGEPRVWDDHVVLAMKVSASRRRIEVRRLHDGSLVGVREIDSVADPALAVWGREIVWRCAPGCLELLRFDDVDVTFVKRMKPCKKVSAPVRYGNSVFAIVDGEVVCMRASDFRVRWSASRGCISNLSILDGLVYALRKTGKRSCRIVALHVDTGKEASRTKNFPLRHEPDDGVLLQVAGRMLLVRFGDQDALHEMSAPGVKLNALQFSLPLGGGVSGSPGELTALQALTRSLHVSPMNMGKGPQLALFVNGSHEGRRLDSCELHRELAEIPATLVPGAVYFGACAVDLHQFHLLWRMTKVGGSELPRSRAIPAGRSLLLFGERELVALRAVAADNGVAAKLSGALRGLQRDQLEPLVTAAIEANDWNQANDLLAHCRELRSGEQWLQLREEQIAAGERNKRRRRRASLAQKVRQRRAAAATNALDALCRDVLAGDDTGDPLARRRGLRFVLRREPDHQQAGAAVRAMLPASLRTTTPFHALDWLDYVDAVAHTKVDMLEGTTEQIVAAGEGVAFTAEEKALLAVWRAKWRADLRAIKSERMLLLSPVTQPGSLAKALVTGELVCDTLEHMFANMPIVRRDVKPMLVFIYPDREDYLLEAKKLGASVASRAAGFYSGEETPPKSRLYVPNHQAGFAGVLPTLAHELTHQWLMDRCTAFAPDKLAVKRGAQGFWIVEGFASLVEQFRFDVEQRRAGLRRGGSLARADMLVSIPVDQHLDWGQLVSMKRGAYLRLLQSRRRFEVGSRMVLGQFYRMSPVDLFYAQSAMLARYLYEAEDGRYRQRLLDFVVSYYTGKAGAVDFEEVFGASAASLGPKVLEFARQRIE